MKSFDHWVGGQQWLWKASNEIVISEPPIEDFPDDKIVIEGT
jgi:hypothetical protein